MKPSNSAFLLALAQCPTRFPCADEVAGMLRRLGFEVSAQQAAHTLKRLSRSPFHYVQIRESGYGYGEYALLPTGRSSVLRDFPATSLRDERREA